MKSLILAAVLAGFPAVAVQAADYPSKPIRVLVPYAPGGVVDTSTRILTNKMAETTGWVLVVDNRPGASGFIATGTAARATPDGYTLLSAHTGEFAVTPLMYKKTPYDFDRDFVPIIMVSDAPMLVVVNSKAPYNSLKDFIGAAKARPGTITFGSPGTGSVNHMATEWFTSAAGIKTVHVPYKGGAPAVTAVAANEVGYTIAGLPGVLPHLQAGRVKVLGITMAKRSPQTPDFPSMEESGVKGVDASIWVGLFAPKGTPKPAIEAIYKAASAVLKQDDVKKRYASVGGAETSGLASAAFTKRVRDDIARYKTVAAQVGVKQQ
jgi:tripartite-type tricarboxylate transporter receptor subunit TctC